MEPSRSLPRAQRSRAQAQPPRRSNTAHLVVAWTPLNEHGTLSGEPTRVELEAKLEPPTSAWISRVPSDANWTEVLSAARCDEVLLTAFSDDSQSRHLVFELAGLLTMTLSATRPLIRVRFLPIAELAAGGFAR